MNEHSFDAFSLKMKESVKKKCRSAPRGEILSVKVDDLTGYETCHTDEKQRLKHGPLPTCACPVVTCICSVAIRALFKSQITNLKIEIMSYSVEQIHNNPWLGVQDVVGDAKT